jgi:hypothetical protein
VTPLHCGWLLPAAALLLATSCSGSDRAPSGDPSVRLVYQVVDLTQGGHRVTTTVIDRTGLQRARTIDHEGDSATGPSLGGSSTDERAAYLVQPGGTVALVQPIPPTFAGQAWHLSLALDFAASHGLAVRGPSSSVGGVACTLWNTFEPVDASPLAPPLAQDHTESCVSDGGLLLEESWSIGGSVVRTRTLVSHSAGPSLDGAGLFAGRTPSQGAAGPPTESVKEVDVTTLVKALGIPAPVAPAGLPPGRTTAVIQPDKGGQGVAVEGGVLEWMEGDRLVILRIERGLLAPLALGTAGVPVTVGSRQVRVLAVANGLKVRFAGPQGLVATVTTDVPLEDLMPWLSTLSLG